MRKIPSQLIGAKFAKLYPAGTIKDGKPMEKVPMGKWKDNLYSSEDLTEWLANGGNIGIVGTKTKRFYK